MKRERVYDDNNKCGKKLKNVPTSDHSLPSPSLQQKVYSHHAIPQDHKRTMYICDDCGSGKKYIETICWLREKGCADGTVFDGIPNLNWNGTSFPFVEIQVVTPENNKAEFMIFKKILYVMAFRGKVGLFQFNNCEIRIEEATILLDWDGKYTENDKNPWSPWKSVGPKAMIQAVNTLATEELKIADPKDHIRAAEIFYVHLCEAAKLYPIEHAVYKSLSHSVAGDYDIFQTYREEAEWLLGDGRVVGVKQDVYNSVKIDGKVDIHSNIDTPSYFEDLLKKHANISKIWFTQALSEGKVIRVRDDDLKRFHLRSLKSIRCIVAVLAWTSLDKILEECKKHCIGASFTIQDYKKMESKVLELQKKKLVFVKEQET